MLRVAVGVVPGCDSRAPRHSYKTHLAKTVARDLPGHPWAHLNMDRALSTSTREALLDFLNWNITAQVCLFGYPMLVVIT